MYVSRIYIYTENDSLFQYVCHITKDPKGGYLVEEVDEIYGKLLDDFTIQMDSMSGVLIKSRKTGQNRMLGRDLRVRNYPIYTPDLTECEYVGDALFTDGWLNPCLKRHSMPEFSERKVRLYIDRNHPYKLVLENPYSDPTGSAMPIFKISGNGYLVIELNGPIAHVLPFVDSGVMYMEKDSEDYEPLYLCNYDAYYYMYTGYFWYQYYQMLDCCQDDYASSHLDGDTITLCNLYYGRKKDYLGCYWWDEDGTLMKDRKAIIKLPKGWDAGVKGIGAGDADAPARYYSLQGVELLEPTRGMPVIEVKNGRSRKVVIR